MNCDEISKLIPLYYYGELSPDQEEQVDEHTHECAACARGVEQQRVMAAALDRRLMDVPPILIEDCRADLMAAVRGGVPHVARVSKGPWTLFLEALGHTFGSLEHLRQPIGAVALIAIGFFTARLTHQAPGLTGAPAGGPINTADVFNTIRSVQPDGSGGVLISYDQTSRVQARGKMNEANIQQLLLAAAHEDNAAVRGESVDLLKNQCRSGEVRDVLLNALAQDPNPYVRIKAMEGLKTLATDAVVRRGFVQALRADDNPEVKMQAIELLAAHRDDNIVGLMQIMVQRENNNSVRLKLEKALREMNASPGTF